MMNIVALAMLLSSLGSVMVLEPMVGERPLQGPREAAQGTFLKAEETVGAAKDTVVEGVTRPVGRTVGWFRKNSEPEDHLAAAREKAAEARAAFEEASLQLKDATVEKFGSTTGTVKEKASDTYHETGKYVGEKTSHGAGAVKDVAGTAEEWAEGGAHAVYNKAGSVKDATYDASAHAVEDAHDAAGYVKDKVYEGAGNAHDAVVDNMQFGVDKTNGTAIDAAEKVKEAGEYAAHETKEAGHGILGRVKDVACKTVECLLARAQAAGSFLPHLGQGVGYVYNDGMVAGGDTAASLKETAGSAAENVGEVAENVKAWTRDGAQDAMNTGRRSYDGARERAGQYYEEGRGRTSNTHDFARDTVREYYDEAGRRYRRAADCYDEPADYYRDGRLQYRGVRGAPSRYYDAARDEAEDLYDGMNDRMRHTYRGARDRAGDYYDDLRDRMGGYIPDRYQDGPRDYSGVRQRARDTGQYYYDRAKFRPSNDLGAVVESMGWRRVGIVPPDHVSVKSSKEVVIGDVQYVWKGKGRPPSDELYDTVLHYTTNSAKGTREGTENVRHGGVVRKDKMDDRSNRDERSEYQEHDNVNSVEEDSIVTRGAGNLAEGVRNAGQAYEAQRSKSGDYADEARQELSSFAGFGEDNLVSDEGGRSFCTWKDLLIRKPVGALLALIRALHLFTFSTVYGSAIWVTFVSSLILSQHIPRQQFGYVQSRMFPVYLRMLVAGQGVLIFLHSIMHPWFSAESVERMQLLNFAVMIASTLLNAYVFEPRATKAMFERLKLEKEEGRGLENASNPLDAKQLMEAQKKKLDSISQQFKSSHGYSSALNLISLGGLTCHLWHLANRLLI